MQAWPHQEEISDLAVDKLLTYNLVYLAMEERTGKSITSILICEKLGYCKSILIITKKKALEGWQDTLGKFKTKKKYKLVNFHQAHKLLPSDYDTIIIDEAHSYISGYPKRSAMWKAIAMLCKNKPVIYNSATPHAQGYQLLYNQLAVSSFSPFKEYKNFYEWYKAFGERDKQGDLLTVRINAYRKAFDHKRIEAKKVLPFVEHLFITKTRAELGFEQEPEDVIHYVALNENIKTIYNHILKHKVFEFYSEELNKDITLICDSPMKLRFALHMLEGGSFKVDQDYIVLSNTEKIDYILKTWGDSKDLVIMYNYIQDEVKLKRFFKNAAILQATSYAEGIDLSMYKHLVIYSQDFSTSKHTQRRARQANKNRTEEIKVHFLLVKNAISEQVYKAVSLNKVNFVDSLFNQMEL
jgi:hypothetical protein